jgi:hypothetical protein
LQRALSRLDFSQETLIISLFWVAFSLAIPTKTGNFEFRHFASNESLTLSVSRNAPPMAIIEDERLHAVVTEPVQEIKRTKGSIIIGAGTPAWNHLQYYARVFEKKRAKKLHIKFAKKNNVKSLERFSELLALVKHVQSDEQKAPVVYAVNFKNEKTPLTFPVYVRAAADVEPLRSPATVSQTLVVPRIVVPASMTETTIPATKHDTLIVYQASAYNVPPVAIPPAASPSKAKRPVHIALPPSRMVAQVAPAPVSKIQLSAQQNVDSHAVAALDVASMGFAPTDPTPPKAQQDLFAIRGQIELSGGLVATGSSTKLDIQWSAGGQSRTAQVDYSTGLFTVAVPTLDTGKVTARLLDESGFVLGIGEAQVDGSASYNQQVLRDLNILVESPETEIRGKEISAYDVDNVFVPIFGAQLFGPSSTQVMAEKNGNFQLKGLGSESTLVLEGYAQEHWGTRIITTAKRNITMPVFSMKMMDSFLSLIGGGADNSDYGVIWGEIKKHSKGVQGVRVNLASAPNIKPIYFNALRIPDTALEATSTNGLFAFAKVPPGIHVVNSQFSGRETPPTVVSVSPSRLSFSQILFKSLEIQGNVIDQLSVPVTAEVKVVGTLESTKSTDQGFKLKVPSSDPVVLVEANAGPNYLTTRSAIARPEAKNLKLQVFEKSWIADKLKNVGINFKDDQSLLIGSVTGQDYHVILDDKIDPKLLASKSEPQIFYFGEKGELDKALQDGQSNNYFVMTNVQPGLHTVLVQSTSGEVTTSRIFIADPGVANVMSLSLRP